MLPMAQDEVTVWDPVVRIGHWLIAIAFAVAFMTEDDLLGLHVWAGYLLGLVLLLRIYWGFVGPKHARFSDFLYGPTAAARYFIDLICFRAKRYVGHSPAGAIMVYALLVCLAATVVSGMAVYGAQEKAGPLARVFASTAPAVSVPSVVRPAFADEDSKRNESRVESPSGRRRGGALKEVHEFLANLTLWLVVAHIGGVIMVSVINRENLVRAMITGRKRADDN